MLEKKKKPKPYSSDQVVFIGSGEIFWVTYS